MAKIKVSEVFYSLQGEGRFVGVPSVFLRTFGCNFTCAGFGCKPGEKSTGADEVAKTVELYKTFNDLPLVDTGCDSYASWHPAYKHLSPTQTTEELVERMLALTPNNQWMQNNGNDVHLVITGGEPLLGWQRAYTELLNHPRMADLKNITFETNGTQELHKDFQHTLLDWTLNPKYGRRNPGALTFSVSAKLSASGEKWEEAIRPDIVMSYQNIGHTYLKFVVETDEHIEDAIRATDEYRRAGFKGTIYLMPQGGVVKPYEANKVRIADICCEQGWNYSPRLHVDLWGNGWGK
ncbi:NrdG Organic radical activating enzymes [uncultured Caudovirales phage]|uniref:NrdG Organic radical activating enzymes n=1 Tax=uncultured Caudovirales phage TaxID=2100421 RepID=A0A6J5LTX7_9CAUD|nr:NrdG Organic radical activating enzymes [uncultured Caudovirales phage]